MRHRVGNRKLGRATAPRLAMLRNQATDLFRYEKIRTTQPKAKELGRLAEHLITLAKRGDLHARRQIIAQLYDVHIANKLVDELRGAVNALTDSDLVVTGATETETPFDARRDAVSRSYEYAIWNAPQVNLWERRWTAHIEDALDLEIMEQACQPLLGRHDF